MYTARNSFERGASVLINRYTKVLASLCVWLEEKWAGKTLIMKRRNYEL